MLLKYIVDNMFTGIINDIGTIQEREERGRDLRFTISTAYDSKTIDLGASISCSGICLTVTKAGKNSAFGDWFSVDVSQETISRTTSVSWQAGTEINLERALKMGDELGGHLVSGHVDGVGKVENIEKSGDCLVITLGVPDDLMPFMAEKGSITVNGISLTINFISKNSLNLNIVPHTLCATTIKSLQVGDQVNLEIDMIARYVNRLLQK